MGIDERLRRIEERISQGEHPLNEKERLLIPAIEERFNLEPGTFDSLSLSLQAHYLRQIELEIMEGEI